MIVFRIYTEPDPPETDECSICGREVPQDELTPVKFNSSPTMLYCSDCLEYLAEFGDSVFVPDGHGYNEYDNPMVIAKNMRRLLTEGRPKGGCNGIL